jgi:hypothetical protein
MPVTRLPDVVRDMVVRMVAMSMPMLNTSTEAWMACSALMIPERGR